jgi:chemosensory pili system protein ChpB (putative protein-glutamate methylesterase)
MKVGVVSASNVQATLIKDELQTVIENVTVFSIRDIEAGLAASSNQHIVVYDISDPSILDSEELNERMGSGDPLALFNEVDLYPMTPEQRLAWRNKTINEMKKLAPDLADELKSVSDKMAASKLDTLIIGSSSGGPLALKEFFEHLPRLNIAVFIAQHMPEAAFGLLLKQVKEKAGTWDVCIGYHGQKVLPGQVIIIPRDVSMTISPSSILEFKPNINEPEYHPCINHCIRSVHAYSKAKTSIVILTGMGEDGAAAVRDLKGKALMVLAQEPNSCASASMPNAARATGAVQSSGTPAELARMVSEAYGFGVRVLN